MLTAILILTIFNIGLIFFCLIGLASLNEELKKSEERIKRNTDEDLAELGTMVFNMDALKQKVRMSGKAEI